MPEEMSTGMSRNFIHDFIDEELADVRLKLMEAVSALIGLGADKITICQGKG